MNDRLDELLSRLPSEPPAPHLAARIVEAVAQRRQTRRRWRRVGLAALASGLGGFVLLLNSWSEAIGVLPALGSLPDASSFSQWISTFLATPQEALAKLAESAIAWEAALSEGIGVLLLLGIVLLTLSAFAGLARLLARATPRNGYSQGKGFHV